MLRTLILGWNWPFRVTCLENSKLTKSVVLRSSSEIQTKLSQNMIVQQYTNFGCKSDVITLSSLDSFYGNSAFETILYGWNSRLVVLLIFQITQILYHTLKSIWYFLYKMYQIDRKGSDITLHFLSFWAT